MLKIKEMLEIKEMLKLEMLKIKMIKMKPSQKMVIQANQTYIVISKDEQSKSKFKSHRGIE